jgi:bifunctional non-homologous end joining protein LigD
VSSNADKATVEVGGRTLTLSNLDKVLFPSGFTKGAVLDYYVRVAPVMLPHLAGRPVTLKRFPEGTSSEGFMEKNVPRHAPEWIRTVVLPRKGTGWGDRRSGRAGRDTTTFAVVDDLPTLVFMANLAAIELHTPMWRLGGDGRPLPPDLIVFDLDPGEPAGIAECGEVAMRLCRRLAAEGIELLAKTSGSKGLQCYGSVASRSWAEGETTELAHAVAEELEREDRELVVSRMAKALRPGKVLIDWSQNNPAKTTVAPYSLRGLAHPSVSTPVSWEEVAQAAAGQLDPLALTPDEVLDRVERLGDLFAPLLG